MRRPPLLDRILRRLAGARKAVSAQPEPPVAPASDAAVLPDLSDVDEILQFAAGGGSSDEDWITALHAGFSDLPLLPALALLHYVNPNDAQAKTLERLRDVPLDDFGRTLVTKWRSGIEASGLNLAVSLENCGAKHEKTEYIALADAVRLMSLSNRSMGLPDSAETAQSLASCASGVARALVRDSRDLFGRADLNREMLANLAFICLGWRSASANMTRFLGATPRSFNHIAFGIGHDLSRSPDVFHAMELSDAPPPQRDRQIGSGSSHPALFDERGHDDIPLGFDGEFEDPIIEDMPSGPGNEAPADDGPALFVPPTADLSDADFPEEPMPLPPEPKKERGRASEPRIEGPSMVVCGLNFETLKDRRTAELAAPHRHVIGVPVRLTPTPDLVAARKTLLAEFPYAQEAIDILLNDLVGRPTIKFEPTVLFGKPGAGKSRFARRLAAVLGMGLMRTDAARSDGNVYGGTDRRWYSAEPCHPFLAISRSRTGNPMAFIDEVGKAAVRNDYGRLWDCLLGFLDVETACCYPDPALQHEVDLGQISYILTSNDLDNLPHELRDRLRVVVFPEPKAEHLDAILPSIFESYLKTRNIDPAWAPPLTPLERDAIAERWKGGSVRRLNALMIGVMRARARNVVLH